MNLTITNDLIAKLIQRFLIVALLLLASQRSEVIAAPVSNPPPVVQPPPADKPSSHESVPKDWPACVEAVAAVLNVLLVLWLFFLAGRQHRGERKAQIAGFWIQELIMRQHNEMLHKFFDDFEERMQKPAIGNVGDTHQIVLDRASVEILEFNAQLHKITHQVIEPLQWIHADFKQLMQIRNDIQDLVTEELSKIPGIANQNAVKNTRSPEDRLAELRKSFFQTIHKIQTRALLDSGSGTND